MFWLTWRQFRTQTWIAVAALVVAAGVLAVGANEIAKLYLDSGIATCAGADACDNLADNFLRHARESASGFAYLAGLFLMYALPLLIGVFWGAPLVAREFETGTFRLVWNQSVTRYRWLAVKLAIIGGASVAITGAASVLVTWAATRVDQVANDRLSALLFGARGVVPMGYALFAFVLGVTAGIVIRRTVPAMATTLGIYTLAVVAMPVWVRSHLLPTTKLLRPFDADRLEEFTMDQDGEMTVTTEPGQPGAWVVDNSTITPDGRIFTGPADPSRCGQQMKPHDCIDWVGSLNLRQSLTFHPASQFWPLQWVETGIFVGLAALLVGVSFWWLRRRAT
jgi:ABC-2 family transporter protein